MKAPVLTPEKADFIRECLGWALRQLPTETLADWIKWERKRLGEKGGNQ